MTRFIPAVQKTLKRIDRSLSGPLVIFSEQFLYGHREILCSYAGLDSQAMIKGSIEHGWDLNSGVGIPKYFGGRYLYLSWCEDRLRRTKGIDSNSAFIGAPFIYLHQTLLNYRNQMELRKTNPKREILFYPTHGNEFVHQNSKSQIELFREFYDPKNSAVCLYWAEYINPEIYEDYKLAGFEIICAGFSGQMENTGLGYSARQLAGSTIGGRPTFLLHTTAFLTSFPKVVLGGTGTICFYASYLGCKIELLHKYINSEYVNMDSSSSTPFHQNNDERKFREHVSNSLNEEFEKIDFSSASFKKLSEKELGKEHMMSNRELKNFLDPHIIHKANPQSLKMYNEKIRDFKKIQDSIN